MPFLENIHSLSSEPSGTSQVGHYWPMHIIFKFQLPNKNIISIPESYPTLNSTKEVLNDKLTKH
jgi:hypothetical protein